MKRLLFFVFFFIFLLGCADLHIQQFSLDLNELLKEFSVDLDKQPKLLPKQKTIEEICREKRKFTQKTEFPTTKGDLITHINTAITKRGDNVDLSYIDTCQITDMSELFKNKTKFNGDISDWDVSHVTNMNIMFYNAAAFNQDISSWNVSSVTDMTYMFTNATAFNQDVSSWDVSEVTDMYFMFTSASAFNNGGKPLTWGSKTSNVTNMSSMFYGASAFNQDISGWDVSSVANMSSMFLGATVFDQDISSWNIERVTDMNWMFYNATAFDNDGNPFGLNTWTINTNKTIIQKMFLSSLMASRGQYPSWCKTGCQ